MEEMLEAHETRLFLGCSLDAAWIDPPHSGRILDAQDRHLTLAFLGNQDRDRMLEKLQSLPKDASNLGFAGWCERLLFLPPRHPHVVATHVRFVNAEGFRNMKASLDGWLKRHGYPVDERPFISHVTLARAPFSIKQWRESFHPFPLLAKGLHLYESLGNSHYKTLWSLPFIEPIEEVEHTADIAFCLRGITLDDLFQHAQLALSWKFPPMLNYFSEDSVASLDELIMKLNAIVSKADADLGCPFKAVSFHGEMVTNAEGVLSWEMIVDV
jgi:2'-5' RNA ligase